MNMRTVHDPRNGVGDPYSDYPNGHASLVDKMIGNAYEVVRYVAKHLDMIRYVGSNMENIHEIATNLKTNGLVLGTVLGLNETASIAIPEGVSQASILSSSVMLVDLDGSLYGPDSGYFSASIQTGALRVFLHPDAPLQLENAVVRWFLTYGV